MYMAILLVASVCDIYEHQNMSMLVNDRKPYITVQ